MALSREDKLNLAWKISARRDSARYYEQDGKLEKAAEMKTDIGEAREKLGLPVPEKKDTESVEVLVNGPGLNADQFRDYLIQELNSGRSWKNIAETEIDLIDSALSQRVLEIRQALFDMGAERPENHWPIKFEGATIYLERQIKGGNLVNFTLTVNIVTPLKVHTSKFNNAETYTLEAEKLAMNMREAAVILTNESVATNEGTDDTFSNTPTGESIELEGDKGSVLYAKAFQFKGSLKTAKFEVDKLTDSWRIKFGENQTLEGFEKLDARKIGKALADNAATYNHETNEVTFADTPDRIASKAVTGSTDWVMPYKKKKPTPRGIKLNILNKWKTASLGGVTYYTNGEMLDTKLPGLPDAADFMSETTLGDRYASLIDGGKKSKQEAAIAGVKKKGKELGVILEAVDADTVAIADKDYIDYFLYQYKNAKFYINGENANKMIAVKVGSEVVGVLMPLSKSSNELPLKGATAKALNKDEEILESKTDEIKNRLGELIDGNFTQDVDDYKKELEAVAKAAKDAGVYDDILPLIEEAEMRMDDMEEWDAEDEEKASFEYVKSAIEDMNNGKYDNDLTFFEDTKVETNFNLDGLEEAEYNKLAASFNEAEERLQKLLSARPGGVASLEDQATNILRAINDGQYDNDATKLDEELKKADQIISGKIGNSARQNFRTRFLAANARLYKARDGSDDDDAKFELLYKFSRSADSLPASSLPRLFESALDIGDKFAMDFETWLRDKRPDLGNEITLVMNDLMDDSLLSVEDSITMLDMLIAGTHDGDIGEYEKELDKAATAIAEAGLLEKHDGKLNQAADRLTDLLNKN